jgi:hypothetical protein
MQTKKFHLGDVLSVTTGRLVSPRHMDGVYDILNFMTGDNLFTHQLPRASDECKPHLLAQFPQLAEVDASGVNTKNHKQWLAEQVAKYGEEFEVKPIPKGAHQFKNPIAEATEMMGGPEKVIVVQTD